MLSLIARMLDDTVRIAEAQAKLFDVNLSEALHHALGLAIARAILAVTYLFGGACLLGAAIVLLHGYVPWWQALAISGFTLVATGWIADRIFLARTMKPDEPERK
jgi:uncharacterized membrane protein YphA (DoxX/SURF4 family)